jgi:hypothetical protein
MFKTLLKLGFELILAPLFSFLKKKISELFARYKARKEAEASAAEAAQEMEQAKTGAQIDEAADKTLDGF